MCEPVHLIPKLRELLGAHELGGRLTDVVLDRAGDRCRESLRRRRQRLERLADVVLDVDGSKDRGRRPVRHPVLDRLVLWAFLFLVLNGAYLGAFAAPTLTYYGNVLLHLLAGVLFLAGFLWVGWRAVFSRASRPSASSW